jgi:hypothetical protein
MSCCEVVRCSTSKVYGDIPTRSLSKLPIGVAYYIKMNAQSGVHKSQVPGLHGDYILYNST